MSVTYPSEEKLVLSCPKCEWYLKPLMHHASLTCPCCSSTKLKFALGVYMLRRTKSYYGGASIECIGFVRSE